MARISVTLGGSRRAAGSDAWVEQAVHWTLRLGVAGCFIGHGVFGLITKAGWLPYFALLDIDGSVAYHLMPLIGMFDIAIGLSVLLFPLRAVLLWAMIWAAWTALLRPLAGEGIWEFLERAGNYGVPLAMLELAGWGRNTREWFFERAPTLLTPMRARAAALVLRVTTGLLLIGHGGFGAFMQKPVWANYLGAVGLSAATVERFALIQLLGRLEIVVGLAVLIWPAPALLLAIFLWKLASELVRLRVGEPGWEVVERAGSYAAPLALYLISRWQDRPR